MSRCSCPLPPCCSRCGRLILESRLVILSARDGASAGARADLCEGCEAEFSAFLRPQAMSLEFESVGAGSSWTPSPR